MDKTQFYNKWWFWLIVAFLVLSLIVSIIPSDSECNCPEKECEYTKEEVMKLCDATNVIIRFSNEQTNYINDFANPGEKIELLDEVDCYNYGKD